MLSVYLDSRLLLEAVSHSATLQVRISDVGSKSPSIFMSSITLCFPSEASAKHVQCKQILLSFTVGLLN